MNISTPRRMLLGLPAALILALLLVALRSTGDYIASRYHAHSKLVDRAAEAKARASELPSVSKVSLELLSNTLWTHTYTPATYAIALEQFRSDLRGIVDTNEVEIITPASAGGLTEMHARVSASVTGDKLADILDRLGANPRVAIHRLHVISPLVQPEDRNAPLQLTMELSGCWASPALREAP